MSSHVPMILFLPFCLSFLDVNMNVVVAVDAADVNVNVAIDAEASQAEGDVINVTVAADLDKGFERVRHDVIRKNAKSVEFS